jgi:cytochrome c oxidase cbb3-type subunit 2
MRAPALIIASLAAAGCASSGSPPITGARSIAPGSVERGLVVYRAACASCHDERGDGKGAAAAGMDPEPRDFTRAVYAYRSTPTGSLPVDRDLWRTVYRGLPGTDMPAWGDQLSAQEILDVVAAVKSMSPRFAEEEIDEPVAVPAPIPYSAESVALGKRAYEKVQCGKCHGAAGRGDGWARESEMKDPLGRVVRARDFTKGIYRSGNRREDLYRVFLTGLDGTPMPAYEESLSPAEIYHLINFMLSLERRRGIWYWLSTPSRWYEPSQTRVPR